MRTLVCVPTYQEAANVDRFLRAVRSNAPQADILVCDDNSPDGTGEIAERTASDLGRITVLHRPGKEGLGAAYREVGQDNPITVNGFYFTTLPDGLEEWHIPIKSSAHSGTFTFNVWYEDGKSGRFYDDNNGELYALRWQDDPSDYTTLSQDYAGSSAVFDATGVKGVLSFTVEDLDYDKELKFLYSTDNWVTTQTFGIGASGDKNSLHWVTNLSRDFERWQIDLDLPGSFTTFRYKLVYRHGVTGGARPVEFTLGTSSGLVLPRS